MIYALLLGYGIFIFVILDIIITASKHSKLHSNHNEFDIYDMIPIAVFIFYFILLHAYKSDIINSVSI